MRRILIILLLTFDIFSIQIYCENQINTSKYSDFTLTYSDKWIINNIEYDIEETAIIGESLYAVKVLLNEKPGKQHENIAKDIAKYAIQNDYYFQAKQTIINDKLIKLSNFIGIAMIDKKSLYNSKEPYIYRFNFKIDDLLSEINIEKLPKTLNNLELNKIIEKYMKYHNENNIKKIYNMYSEYAKTQITFEKFNSDYLNVKVFIDKILSGKYSYYLYLGKKGNVKGYYIYYDIKFTSSLLKNNIGMLRIMIVDEPKKYGIYGLKNYFSR